MAREGRCDGKATMGWSRGGSASASVGIDRRLG